MHDRSGDARRHRPARGLDHSRIVGPVEQCLPLSRATAPIAARARLLELDHVPAYGAPATDLPRVVVATAAHVVTAVPLEPAARILRRDPPFLAPHRQRL